MLDNKALDPIATLFCPVEVELKFVVQPMEMFVGWFPPPLLTNKLLIEPESEAVTDVAIIVPVPVIVGEVIAGDAENTTDPAVPVSSVNADAKLADDGVAKNVATLVPKPDTPVEIGNPDAFVKILPAATVPRTGDVKVGDVARTTAPVPITAVIPVVLILRTLPVPAVSKVLFVNVSVVALPTKVSAVVGNINVPVFTIELITGDVKVLFVNVWVQVS